MVLDKLLGIRSFKAIEIRLRQLVQAYLRYQKHLHLLSLISPVGRKLAEVWCNAQNHSEKLHLPSSIQELPLIYISN